MSAGMVLGSIIQSQDKGLWYMYCIFSIVMKAFAVCFLVYSKLAYLIVAL